MKVTEWIPYAESDQFQESFGGLGGFFNFHAKGQRWKDYLDIWDEKVHPYAEALREAILAKELREGGDWHQGSDEGVPKFSDETVARFSYRAWGDLLAAIWSEKEDKDYSYMDFYMSEAGTPLP